MLLSDVCLSDICLTSVAYIGPNSRTDRPRKTKICTEVAHVTRDSDTNFKVKGKLVADVSNSQHAGTGATWRISTKTLATCRGRRHIAAASGTSLFFSSIFCDVPWSRQVSLYVRCTYDHFNSCSHISVRFGL